MATASKIVKIAGAISAFLVAITMLQSWFVTKPITEAIAPIVQNQNKETQSRQDADSALFREIAKMNAKQTVLLEIGDDILTNTTYSRREVNDIIRKSNRQVNSRMDSIIENLPQVKKNLEKRKERKREVN